MRHSVGFRNIRFTRTGIESRLFALLIERGALFFRELGLCQGPGSIHLAIGDVDPMRCEAQVGLRDFSLLHRQLGVLGCDWGAGGEDRIALQRGELGTHLGGTGGLLGHRGTAREQAGRDGGANQ